MDGGRGGVQGFPAHPGMTLLGIGGVLAKGAAPPAAGGLAQIPGQDS